MPEDAPSPRIAFAASLSTKRDSAEAIAEVCREAAQKLGGDADLAVLFASTHHAAAMESIAQTLASAVAPRFTLGCTGESIVGNGREIEDEPALSLWLGSLPGVSIETLHLQYEPTVEGGSFLGWPDGFEEEWPVGSVLMLLADPFSFPADDLLTRLNEDNPGLPIVGGMASGARQPGETCLLYNGQVFREGAVGARIHGPVSIRSVVSQGCRPIGRHYVITKARQNIIEELGGKPAMVQLQELFAELPAEEQKLLQSGVHVGRVINEYQPEFGRGDFLVRNVIGADPQSGAIAIGDYVRAGQTIQFHVRDAKSADEELRALLGTATEAGGKAEGGLIFTCNGRGTRLFSEANHDAGAVQQTVGEIPLAGFFAQGEIGPVGGKNFLHGFTASVVLFGGKS